LPGTRLAVRPVDLLAAIRFLRYTKAKVSPRAIRYEFDPGEEPKLILEPWEHPIPLRHAEHSYTEKRIIRTWGRRRLSLLEPMLPFAERVDIYLKGRALPSFYAVKLPGITFVLGLSGWTSQRWTSTAGFDLLVAPEKTSAGRDKALAVLKELYSAQASDVASVLSIDLPAATRILTSLCAEGRCMYDVESRAYRSRELFTKPIDLAKVYPPDRRREDAERFIAQAEVQIASAAPRETRKPKRFKTPEGPVYREVVLRDWVVQGRVADQPNVELVLNDEDRLIFGRCSCPFFRENILGQGPCEHLLALLLVAQPQRKDAASSITMEKEAFEASGPAEAPSGADGHRRRQDREEGLDEDEESGDDS